jgi:hypothetical protein
MEAICLLFFPLLLQLTRQDLTNATVLDKAWKIIPPHKFPEANNTFFPSSKITFTEMKNTLKVRYGVLWN